MTASKITDDLGNSWKRSGRIPSVTKRSGRIPSVTTSDKSAQLRCIFHEKRKSECSVYWGFPIMYLYSINGVFCTKIPIVAALKHFKLLRKLRVQRLRFDYECGNLNVKPYSFQFSGNQHGIIKGISDTCFATFNNPNTVNTFLLKFNPKTQFQA